MTEKRFKDIGCHIKNMGYDKNVKFGIILPYSQLNMAMS